MSTTPAIVIVRTFKAGALAAMGHDLELQATSTSFVVDPELRAEVDAASLRVLHAVRAGAPDPRALSTKDRSTIEQNARDVLEASRYPTVSFVARTVTAHGTDAVDIEGELELHGVRRPISFRAARDGAGGPWTADIELDQRNFGIKPYSAFLGALRLQPRLVVHVEVPGSTEVPSSEAKVA